MEEEGQEGEEEGGGGAGVTEEVSTNWAAERRESCETKEQVSRRYIKNSRFRRSKITGDGLTDGRTHSFTEMPRRICCYFAGYTA